MQTNSTKNNTLRTKSRGGCNLGATNSTTKTVFHNPFSTCKLNIYGKFVGIGPVISQKLQRYLGNTFLQNFSCQIV